jgi:hypothetical protein
MTIRPIGLAAVFAVVGWFTLMALPQSFQAIGLISLVYGAHSYVELFLRATLKSDTDRQEWGKQGLYAAQSAVLAVLLLYACGQGDNRAAMLFPTLPFTFGILFSNNRLTT